MPRLFLCALAILLLSVPGAANTPAQLTPENAVEILYTHIKRVDYRPLLAFTVDPERKRIAALVQNLETNRVFSADIRQRANALIGYKIHHSEVHDTVAAIMFTWRYRNDFRPAQPGLSNPNVIENGCEALLIKENGVWKLAATRPWVPDNERGSAFLQQQYNSRNQPRPR